jgi:DNA processing protein
MAMSSALTEHQALLVLNGLANMGPVTLNRLLDAVGGDPRLVLSADARTLASVQGVTAKAVASILEWEKHMNLPREEERLAQAGAFFLPVKDPGYPELLREIHDPPIGLYRMGNYDFSNPCIGIVGSRRATLYGQSVARSFGAELARLGFCVVSGLARGIDTAAHEGALSVNGRTAAVLGTGLDIIYPPENLALYRRIAEAGAVLSEFPFGRKADRQSFAMRNRIISGMSQAVVVVESDEDGGAMITAKFAGEQGRMLLVVPGRIDQPTSRGCHQLIRDGATLVTGVADILQELNYLAGMRTVAAKEEVSSARVVPDLSPVERAVMDCFAGGESLTVDLLAERLGDSASAVAATLMMLELRALVARRQDGSYEAVS